MKKRNKELLPESIWEKGKQEKLNEFILSQSSKQSNERILRNELLSIQYKIEDYIESESPRKKISIHDFVKMYLQVLNSTQKNLADLFEMQNSNLHKYLVGERKLNQQVLMKLSAFSHTNPEYWLRIEMKNELLEINKEKNIRSEYKKYDYRNLSSRTLKAS